jgi:hypothetical protein
MAHHTKDKGDTGVGNVIAHLMSSGIKVALPLCEHLPFDLIAISERGELRRLSVKYRSLEDSGTIAVSFRSSWADRHGSHMKPHDMTSYDATAIFCPETKDCYFVRNDEVGTVQDFTIRIEQPKKLGKQKSIRWANSYKGAGRLFE